MLKMQGGNKRIFLMNAVKQIQSLAVFSALLVAMIFSLALTAQATGHKTHKLAIQVNEANWKKINMALNNATNVIKYYGVANVEVEIVAYGPGLDMFHKNSKVRKRLQYLNALGNVKFAVCKNTMNLRKFTKNDMLADAFIQDAIVPSGVVRLMELQEQGWVYIRP